MDPSALPSSLPFFAFCLVSRRASPLGSNGSYLRHNAASLLRKETTVNYMTNGFRSFLDRRVTLASGGSVRTEIGKGNAKEDNSVQNQTTNQRFASSILNHARVSDGELHFSRDVEAAEAPLHWRVGYLLAFYIGSTGCSTKTRLLLHPWKFFPIQLVLDKNKSVHSAAFLSCLSAKGPISPLKARIGGGRISRRLPKETSTRAMKTKITFA